MSFDSIIGNPSIKSYLNRLLVTKAMNQSLLFAGLEGVGKSLFAKEFAQMILKTPLIHGTHPDLHIYVPEGKLGLHSIQKMRQFSEEVHMAPFSADHKIFIIEDADRMLPTSANALLKTFEEPTNDTVIILLSSAPAAILPTILSRCRTIHFQAISEEEISKFLQEKWQKSSEEAQAIAQRAEGSLGRALLLLNHGGEAVRTAILNQTSKGSCGSYKELTNLAAELTLLSQNSIKQSPTWREELLQERKEQLTAAQKQSIEKEIDGAIAMRELQGAQDLFATILGWYRDMQLLQVNGDRRYLTHPDYAEACEQALQRGELLALEFVQQALAEARLALQRSTPLHFCLEMLLLKLNFF